MVSLVDLPRGYRNPELLGGFPLDSHCFDNRGVQNHVIVI